MNSRWHALKPDAQSALSQRDYGASAVAERLRTSGVEVGEIAGKSGARIGGFTLSDDGRRLVVVSVLDNLLKGAAVQALQNLNLAFGYPEIQGIP